MIHAEAHSHMEGAVVPQPSFRSELPAEVVKSDFEEAGSEDVVRKVAGDLGDKADADTVRRKMDELLIVAKGQLVKEN